MWIFLKKLDNEISHVLNFDTKTMENNGKQWKKKKNKEKEWKTQQTNTPRKESKNN